MKSTVKVTWLSDCPACGNGEVAVTGINIRPDMLRSGSSVECLKCSHRGEIDCDGDEAVWVEWGEVTNEQ